jgi:alkanesulfonate monooxygenase
VLPVSVDETYIGLAEPEGVWPTPDYLARVGATAEAAGFDGLLVPSFYQFSLEAWLTATTLLARTERIRALIAVRPSQYHPAQAAKMAHTLAHLFPSRVELNVTSGAWDEDAWIGNFDDRETRYERVREWLEIVEGLWYDDIPFSYNGSLYRIERTELYPELTNPIRLLFSGGSEPARRIAVDHADGYLLFGAPIADVRSEIEHMRALTPPGRQLQFGLRINMIVRESEQEAWRAANALISRADPEVVQLVADRSRSSSPTRRAQYDLSQCADFTIAPNLWAGVGTVRFGVAVSLVGNPDQVVERLLEFKAAGVDFFILGGFPHLDEAARVGELVVSQLRQQEAVLLPSGRDKVVQGRRTARSTEARRLN